MRYTKPQIVNLDASTTIKGVDPTMAKGSAFAVDVHNSIQGTTIPAYGSDE